MLYTNKSDIQYVGVYTAMPCRKFALHKACTELNENRKVPNEKKILGMWF